MKKEKIPSQNQLKISEITKSIGFKKIVKGISFEISSGQIAGLLGPNGAGKTTSFYMIAGLISPDKGDIYLNETKIDHLPLFKRSRLGLAYLPQESSIFRRITVEDNIRIAQSIHDHLPLKQREEQLEELLDDLNIKSLRHSYGSDLSGGERRRVEIARSLALSPKFLLFDEPFAGVDPITVENVQKIIFNLKERNVGVLITDHNVRETLKICDKAYILREGQIEAEGTREEVASCSEVKKFYLGQNFKL